MEIRKNCATLLLTGAFLLGFLIWGLLKPDEAASKSERRKLAQLPEFNVQTVLNGSFMEDFESYALDQFPLREQFRRLKAETVLHVLRQSDNNGIYVADGYASKLDDTLDTASVDHAAARFRTIYDRYLSSTDVTIYAAVIPDKNYYLSQKTGYPALDLDALAARLYGAMDYAQPVELRDVLSLEGFYRTDLHWRQEALLPAARRLAEAMGVTLTQTYTPVDADAPFYGVYCAQSALPLAPDTLTYLESDELRACTVYDYETGQTLPVYDPDAAEGEDPYALFLHGSRALLTVTNPNASSGRHLVIFRDSFASSLAPLLLEAYETVTLVDIRYLAPERLGSFLTFDDQDVLFLYSLTVLNASAAIK